MKKYLIVSMILSTILCYGGGGVIVTQGDCCSGGGGGSGVADGVGIYSVTAKNLLSNDNDSTIADGGIADRNTLKDMRLFEYSILRNDTANNLYQSIELESTKFGTPTLGLYQSKNGGINFIGSSDNGSKYGYNAMIAFNNIFLGSSIITDTNSININYVDEVHSSYVVIDKNTLSLNRSNTLTGDSYMSHYMNNTNQIIQDISMPITASGYYPVTQIIQDQTKIALYYNPSYNGAYPATRGGLRVSRNGNPNTEVLIENINGDYKLSTTGQHYFNSFTPVTASFNGDIEATAFNIISDKRLKENIKEYSEGLKLINGLNPKTFNYKGVIRYDSLPIYETVCKKVKKTYTPEPTQFNKNPQPTTVMVDDCKQVIKGYDIKPISISSDDLHIGLIAQEVEKVAPELVSTNATTGLKTVNYVELIPALINSIQELNKRIEQLENK